MEKNSSREAFQRVLFGGGFHDDTLPLTCSSVPAVNYRYKQETEKNLRRVRCFLNGAALGLGSHTKQRRNAPRNAVLSALSSSGGLVISAWASGVNWPSNDMVQSFIDETIWLSRLM